MELFKHKITLENYHILKAMGFKEKGKIQLVFNKRTKTYFGRVNDEYKIFIDSFIENNERVSKSEIESLKYRGLALSDITMVKSNNAFGIEKPISFYVNKSVLGIMRGKKNAKTKN